VKPHVVVDTRGFFCPVPVIKTSEALRNLDPGTIVEVIADDPAIEFDLPAWCWSNGHTILESSRESGVRRFLVEKGEERERKP
jgi:tRNA 2-thiouridine synthesizing protein A